MPRPRKCSPRKSSKTTLFDIYGDCPACGVKWAYEWNDAKYTRCIGVEIQGKYDGVSFWRCPDCKVQWDRWTGARV
jgi:hypothetical protein